MNFLKNFLFDPSGYLAVATGKIAHGQIAQLQYMYLDAKAVEGELAVNVEEDVYFAPAVRKTKGNEKSDVLGTAYLWVDVDSPVPPQGTLAPTMTVFSGHGYHLYYAMSEPLLDIEDIERLNKILAKDVVGGDVSCWNVNRILRLPGTVNTKEGIIPVELRQVSLGNVYEPQDIETVAKLSKATRHHIRTGDVRGFRSRSERDWDIVQDLIKAGASNDLIIRIFDSQPCGDKHRTGGEYLKHTLERARTPEPAAEQAAASVVEEDDCYYVPGRQGLRKVSTFVFDPDLLLDGTPFQAEDAIVGTVRARSHIWKKVTFNRSAFTSLNRFDKQAPVAAWQFLGSDSELRRILPHLLDRLQAKGMPRVVAAPVMGLHTIEDKPYYITDQCVLSADAIWTDYTGPVAWLPNQREHPTYAFDEDEKEALARAKLLTQLNEPTVVWPMIGWYTASVIKPWLEAQTYRFPILNVVGTKGSGKTTLIQRVFMPMLSQKEPKSYNADTTRFVSLAVMGSSNACPASFSEFRYDAVEKFIRYILLAYDTGHDPRGRADQTTVDYALSAPFSVDGEDLIQDPAARERIIVAFLHPRTVREGSACYEAFQQVRQNPPRIGRTIVQTALRMIASGEMTKLLARARADIMKAFPQSLPDRVRNNHIVTALGIHIWCKVVGQALPDWNCLERSIMSVYDLKAGHTQTVADAMVEEVVNTCAAGHEYFRHIWDNEKKVLYFQLTSAHSWWLSTRKRQGRGTFERDAIAAQLLEASYIVSPAMINGAWMYGVDVVKAQELGLDIPTEINTRQLTINF